MSKQNPQTAVQTFAFNGVIPVRIVTDENQAPWFIAKDVAEILDYSDAFEMTKKLDKDEIQNLQIAGFGNRGVNLINESGLYHAILTSYKPEAEKFRKWVTSEVLPAIRKTGAYNPAQAKVLSDEDFDDLKYLAGLTREHQKDCNFLEMEIVSFQLQQRLTALNIPISVERYLAEQSIARQTAIVAGQSTTAFLAVRLTQKAAQPNSTQLATAFLAASLSKKAEKPDYTQLVENFFAVVNRLTLLRHRVNHSVDTSRVAFNLTEIYDLAHRENINYLLPSKKDLRTALKADLSYIDNMNLHSVILKTSIRCYVFNLAAA